MVFFVGSTSIPAFGSGMSTEAAFPAGTIAGDFAILGLLGGMFPGTAVCNDPRMTLVNGNTFDGRPAVILVGVVSDPATPLAIQLMGQTDFPIGQFAIGALFVFRRMRWLAGDGVVNSSDGGGSGGSGTIPAFAGNGSGTLCVMMQDAGFSGAHLPDWTLTGGVYQGIATADNSYVRISLGMATQEPTPEAPTPVGVDQTWRATLLGFTSLLLAPPCRVYPREDNQGVGSGRIWPPPRSHQASSRRGGGSHY